MFVGVCRIELRIPEIGSLKAKRSIVRKVVERTAKRFTVSVAEVDDQDIHRRAVVGVAVVSSSSSHANTMIDHIVSFISDIGEAVVERRDLEIVPFREAVGGYEDASLRWSDFEDEDGS